MGMPAGRPSKYDPAYCDAIVEHMAEGASATSFAAEINVDRSTITQWAEVHPEFSLALKCGKAKCAAWWEKAARNLVLTGEGNATMTVFGLKNMSKDDWQEKQLVGSDPENPLPAGFTVNLVKSKSDK